jgi:hypothetical protein
MFKVPGIVTKCVKNFFSKSSLIIYYASTNYVKVTETLQGGNDKLIEI